jgi:outer membrane lipoprotein-sorting protein
MSRTLDAIALLVLAGLTTGHGSAQDAEGPAANPVAIGSPLRQTKQIGGGAVGEQLSKRQIETIQKVSLYFNQLGTLKGTFVQTSADGKRQRGKFYIKRPGQFRFDYARPSMLVILSDGRYVAIQDHDLGTDDRWGLEQTPFLMLLRKDVDLLRDARFFDVQENADTVAITLEDKGADSSGRIKLLLSKKPSLELREWTAKDAQGLDTQVVLGDIAKTDDLDSDLFNPASKTRERQR